MAVHCLERYHWPGNVRELRNAIERAVVFATQAQIQPDDLPERISGMLSRENPLMIGGDHTLANIERAHVSQVLHRHGSIDAAALVLGVAPSTLYRMRKRRSG
jgi:NtrC-family two-component system response regulator AlgB